MTLQIFEIAPTFPGYDGVFALRNSILRTPLGLMLSREEVQAEQGQIHLAAFESNQLVGCVLLVPLQDEMKLRQMAIAPAAQGRGVGRKLLFEAERLARSHGYKTMSCHARETAVDFYKANGWTVKGERFTEVTIAHFTMSKNL